MTEPTMHPIIRKVPENHVNTAPDCDEACARWGGLEHAHICPDGLYDDHPFLDITAWCSCGQRLGGPVSVDARTPGKLYRDQVWNAGVAFSAIFTKHMYDAHGIDIFHDDTWRQRLATAP